MTRRTKPAARTKTVASRAPARVRKTPSKPHSGARVAVAAQPARRTTSQGAPVPAALLKGRLSPDEFKAELQRRGWNIRKVSMRWGVGENWVSKLAANVNRALHWDDAVRGLPLLPD